MTNKIAIRDDDIISRNTKLGVVAGVAVGAIFAVATITTVIYLVGSISVGGAVLLTSITVPTGTILGGICGHIRGTRLEQIHKKAKLARFREDQRVKELMAAREAKYAKENAARNSSKVAAVKSAARKVSGANEKPISVDKSTQQVIHGKPISQERIDACLKMLEEANNDKANKVARAPNGFILKEQKTR